MSDRYFEYLHDSFGQFFVIEQVLYESRTEHQHLIIFENQRFGRVMALDGVIQTTEADEFIYHEMLVHVPLMAHGNPKRVLIIGGGDGGSLREALKYPCIEKITQVEIDPRVIELCKTHLPNHSQGAFDDPRAEIVIADGFEYVRHAGRHFDAAIIDSTDPIGPGAVLFSSEFYAACQGCLVPGGVLATQNGVAFLQMDEVINSAARLAPLFRDVRFFAAAVPTYSGGIMAFGWASDDPSLRQTPLPVLRRRYAEAGLQTRYYHPVMHKAAFALPQYLLDALS